MAVRLKLPVAFVELAKTYAESSHRTVSEQIEYWARLGKAVEENPELPVQFTKDSLLEGQEAIAGKGAPHRFGA